MYFIIIIEKDKVMAYGYNKRLYVAERLAQGLANFKQCVVLIQDDEKKVMFIKPEKRVK